MSGYSVEVLSRGDQRGIGAFVDDVVVAEAWEPDLPTGVWRIAVPGSGLPEATARDKDGALAWIYYLAAALVAGGLA